MSDELNEQALERARANSINVETLFDCETHTEIGKYARSADTCSEHQRTILNKTNLCQMLKHFFGVPTRKNNNQQNRIERAFNERGSLFQ